MEIILETVGILYMTIQFDRGLDPLSTILRWAIPAWEFDPEDTTFQTCFQRPLHIEEAAETQEQEVIKELPNHIKNAMDINEFPNHG
jgi:hypothetical protein